MTPDVIVRFKACKISSTTDGSDDGIIYYLKPGGGVAHSAVEALPPRLFSSTVEMVKLPLPATARQTNTEQDEAVIDDE